LNNREPTAAAAPQIRRRKGISLVWLLPLIAMAVAGWLAYRAVSERGPTITIQFHDGAGLEVGKTPIKFKAVNVGRVESIDLSDDLTTVQVTAELNKRMSASLMSGTRFWIVRPRVGLSGVSGLGTLVSGAFIELEPGDGQRSRSFVGMEEPPIVRASEQGQRYVLEAEQLGSLALGSPVYFRSVQAGQILGHELSPDNSSVLVYVFVKAPFHKLVRKQSRFWNVSGVEFSVDSNGVDLRIGSLHTLFTGGVAFDSPAGSASGLSKDGDRFPLFQSKAFSDTSKPARPLTYAMYFDGSVRGLSPGAPVEFRGIRIGSVRDVRMELDSRDFSVRIPVLVDIDPERITAVGDLEERGAQGTIEELVKRGLRARLQTGSLLTGQLYVDVKRYDEAPAAVVGHDGDYPVIPTVPSTLDEFERSAQDVLAHLRDLPLSELVGELLGAARGANKLANSSQTASALREMEATFKQYRLLASSIDKELQPLVRSIDAVAVSARKTLSVVEPGSELQYDLNATLKELSAAARSLRILAQYLERHPEALVSGRK
jgi:paraquat-inducible protein B